MIKEELLEATTIENRLYRCNCCKKTYRTWYALENGGDNFFCSKACKKEMKRNHITIPRGDSYFEARTDSRKV